MEPCTSMKNHLKPCAFNFLVNGGWGEWFDITPCNATECGGGVKTQSRLCNRPYPRNGGTECIGVDTRLVGCFNFSNCAGTFWNKHHFESVFKFFMTVSS